MQSCVTDRGPAKDIGLAFFIALAIFGLAAAWKDSSAGVGVDFYQFWVVGQALHQSGTTNIYSDNERLRLGGEYLQRARQSGMPRELTVANYRQRLETYSSPFLYSVLRLFSTSDYETDFRNYRFFLLVWFAFSTIMLSRLLDHSWNTTLGAVAFFSAWFGPFSSDMRVGNVNSLLLAALVVFLWVVTRMPWRHRDILGGFIIGLAVAFKPNLIFVPGALAVAWIFNGCRQRLWRHLAGAAIAIVTAFVITAFNFRSGRCWIDWLSALQALPAGIITVQLGNEAPSQILTESLGMQVGLPLAVIFGMLAVAGLWLQRTGPSCANPAVRKWDAHPETLALALGCLLVILIPKLAWEHYYMLTIPAFLLALNSSGSATGCSWARPFLVVLALFGISIKSPNPIYIVSSPSPCTAGGFIVMGTLVLMLLVVFPPEAWPGRFSSTTIVANQ